MIKKMWKWGKNEKIWGMEELWYMWVGSRGLRLRDYGGCWWWLSVQVGASEYGLIVEASKGVHGARGKVRGREKMT